jgi:hypothetical protein
VLSLDGVSALAVVMAVENIPEDRGLQSYAVFMGSLVKAHST